STGLPAARLDSGDAATGYILRSLEIYRKTMRRAAPVPENIAGNVKHIQEDSAESYFKRGYANETEERYAEAIDAYRQAIKMRPDYMEAYINLGIMYYRLGRYHEAIEAYQQALKRDPLSPSILNKLGTIYLILGEYAITTDAFRNALSSNPQNPETHYHLGIAYFLDGNKDAALEEYILLHRLDQRLAENLFDLMYR
ncbi:MAG: tetratricopeptide repeat protein, partial [Nitrospira sp.]|nr:tetratricopeptide repeat protein [Nitrospira sp.]